MATKVVANYHKLKKEDDAMNTVTPSNTKTTTDEQINKAVGNYRALLEKHAKEFPSKAVQQVLGDAEFASEQFRVFRTRVEELQRAHEPHILKRLPFDPVDFLGKGWIIDEELKQRTGDNLDAGQISVNDYLKEDESHITGEERLKRIKEATNDIQLDADDFRALWEEERHATLKWLYNAKGIIFLSFWGTVLRSPDGRRHVLYLYRGDGGSWYWDFRWLGNDWDAGFPASLLTSSN